jgi:trk system potassium uptake protein TrkA
MNYKIIGVLGLGIFGRALVEELTRYNTEVIGIDKEEHNIDAVKEHLQTAIQAETVDRGFLEDVDFQDCDIAVVGSGMRLEDTVLALEYVQELGVEIIYAIADSTTEKKILSKMGATEVIVPKVEMGRLTGRKLMRPFVDEMVELRNQLVVAEFHAPEEWYGKTIEEMSFDRKYGVMIIGIRRTDSDEVELKVDTNTTLQEETLLIGIARKEDFDHFAEVTRLGYDLKLDS